MDLPPQAPRGWHGRPEPAPRERSGAPCGEDGVALGPALWRPWTRVLWLTFRVVSGFGNVSVGAGSTRRHPGLSVRVQGAAAWGLWSPRGKGCCSEAGASPGAGPSSCRPRGCVGSARRGRGRMWGLCFPSVSGGAAGWGAECPGTGPVPHTSPKGGVPLNGQLGAFVSASRLQA